MAVTKKQRRQSVLSRVSNWLIDKSAITLFELANKPVKRVTLTRNLIKVPLEIGGFLFLTKAGFEVSSILGLAIAGLACFGAAWHYGSDRAQADPVVRR